MASEQESSNGPVKKSMREKAIERRCINKEHNSNFKAGYVPIEEERLHKTGLRGRKGNMAVCIVILLFLLALINLIITLVIWTVIRIGPNGCDSMEFHETGLLRFKQKADMGIIHPLHKSTVGGRKDQDLVLVGNNNPVVFQQGTTKLSVEKDKTSVVSDVGISFTDPRTQTTFFSTDFENHEFHLPEGVKVLSVKKASTERITSSASSDLNIKGDSKAIIRGNEGVNIMGRTVEFKMGGGIELRAENSIVLNGSVMFNATRIPNSAGDVYFDEGMERYKLCMCADGTLFRVQSGHKGQIVMAVAQGPSLAAVLLLVSSGLHCSSLRPPCPESCSCQKAPLLNCSSSGLSLVPQHIRDSVTELDLSHNLLDTVTLDQPHRNLRSVLLGNNSITHLSLCIERNLGSRYVRGRPLRRFRLSRRRGCVSWAPTLQLLSVERNQLEELPQGLEGSESVQVLQLSFNRISTLRPGELSHLRQLKELHLRHNLITSLHPQMFQDLAQLQVLDLSFNMLTSLHPLIYLSLRNIGTDVMLGGNRWQCDCSMRSLRRWLAYDSSRGLQSWSMVCASPSILSGRDLLQLEEDDLNCFGTEKGPELHQDVTVYSGSEILLSCSTQDSVWWMPSGQASVSQPQAGLLISDITERDTGLYVCVSKEHNILSVFSLQISKIGEQRQYENEAYYNDEEPEHVGNHRERRVTFSTVEDGNVQYYDTIPNLESNNNDAVIECEAAEAEKDTNTARSRRSSLEMNQRDGMDLSGGIEAGRTHKIEFEHIPDPVELDRRRLSSCSDSSLSDKIYNEDKMTRGDHLTPKSRQLAKDSVQQRADASTARKEEGTRELPGFSSEPFADWSPHVNNTNLTYCDLGQDNEEQFEFSDSVQSPSSRSSSVCGSFNDSKFIVAPTTDKQKTDDMSSSISFVSEDEVTQYIVNSDQEEEEEDIERNDAIKPQWPAQDLGHATPIKRRAPLPPTYSSSSGASAKETMDHVQKQDKPPHLPSSPPPDSPSSSSSESETGSNSSRIRRKRREVGMQGIIHTESSQSLTNIPHIRRALDIRAPLQRESSSSNSEDETIDNSGPDLSLGVPRVKRRLDVKATLPEQSDSPSSCSESENKVTGYTANQSRHASNISEITDDDSLITYKRIIMKASSPPNNSIYPSGKGQTIDQTKQIHMGTEMLTVAQEGPFHSVGDRNASLAPERVPSMNFNNVVKKRIEQPKYTTGVDLPPEIKWIGVGRQLSDLSIPSPRRHLDVGSSSPQHASSAEPELPQPDSSSIESDHTKQDRGRADVTLMHKHSSLSSNSVSLASSRAEERSERKGLSALKAMSSLRRKWEPLDENLDKGASPVLDYHDPQSVTSFNYRKSEKDIKPLAKQPLTPLHLSSTSVDERRATDLLYDIPHYRRHDIGGIEPPQGAPPPIPATLPPYE
ncbi:hypothetical protein EPR50_G00094510 [Perca flavescens]|uniref:Beta-sarcoglycan n=1 Tax=Perca flavescens TaxID=8167 RepID=A0A484CYQ5_PERFV|nr:hypothetical protein EPR50_G00094510 [Perca flavescens]